MQSYSDYQSYLDVHRNSGGGGSYGGNSRRGDYGGGYGGGGAGANTASGSYLGGNDPRYFLPLRQTFGKHYASDTYAALIGNEYKDYWERFQPYEQRLMQLSDSTELLDAQLSRITANSARQFNQARANSALMNQKYGIQMTDRMQQTNDTRMAGQYGLTVANSKNMSRLAAKDRNMGILTGSNGRQAVANYVNTGG
ncbi:hypothetical protein [Bowmanella sp. JS7-9]|uniref:Uncharacterized protein n=1 Tax=Pseudobowmanella zhangzhouensis TaxID=1537679 RepID=A0ABW1XLH5_9ALTE|nr:hypothetical protein [Bowmanella sp. JS7-9]